MEEKKNLPTVAKIFEENHNTEIAALHENLNYYLSQPPPAKWVKEHPYIKGYRYLPIDKIELLLRKIFKKYRIRVMKTGMLLNAVEVTVRVYYLDPVSGKLEYHDGVGAAEIQTKEGTGPLKLDMSNVSRGAVMMALPIAKTVAVKDACDHFGDLFGCNLNRKDVIAFTPDISLDTPGVVSQIDPLIQESLDLITDLDGLDKYIWQVTSADPKLNKNWAVRAAFEKKRKELQPKE